MVLTVMMMMLGKMKLKFLVTMKLNKLNTVVSVLQMDNCYILQLE